MSDALAPCWREAEFMPVDLAVERRRDGTVLIVSRVPLRDYEPNLALAFADRAAQSGAARALGWRDPAGAWTYRSYAQVKRDVDGAAQWLIDWLPRGSAIVVLGENSHETAVITLAAHAAGMIAAPVSLAYGLVGGDHARLRHVFAKVRPAAVFADSRAALGTALDAVGGPGLRRIARHPAAIGGGIAFAELIATQPTAAVAASIAALDVDAPAQYMLTSGSTGMPKVVPQTMRAMAACGAQGLDMIGKAAGWDEEMLDWLPWHHAAGASVLRTCLLEGGTLHIDAGKPAPGLFPTSLANLRDVPVTYFNNVPAGYAMLVDALEADLALRASFFKKLRLMLYGGAGLPQLVYDRLQALAVGETGCRVHMTTGYGMTETVSGCMAIYWPDTKVGIGLPAPALELKLVPEGARYEVRLRGPNVMTGYLGDPVKTAEAFDDEGFYRTGDLAVFHDPADPAQGLVFAGRRAEEFKLASGAWVYGGALREGLLRTLPTMIAELVLADDGRPALGLLAWPRPGVTLDALADAIAEFNAGQRGGAVIRRVTLLTNPPDPVAHEVSDKGTINRRAVLDHRSALVEQLYAEPPPADVRAIG